MAEREARQRQYDYRANSNLVLTAETRTREAAEPSGEPESLHGRMRGKMGDRVQHAKPEGFEARKQKQAKKRQAQQEFELEAPKQKRRAGGVMNLDTASGYRPRTQETRAAYEAILSFIREQFGDQPQDVLKGAADEILAVLKDDKKRDPERQKECEELLGPVGDDKFTYLKDVGRLITDFSQPDDEPGAPGDALDDDIGVAVEFEGDEDADEESEVDEVEDPDDDDIDDDTDTMLPPGEVRTGADVEAGEDARDEGLKPADIDAYWLQRNISKAYGNLDENEAVKKSEEVFSALQSAQPDSQVETHLVDLLDFDKFALIKMLVQNRLKVVWCMRLNRAPNDEEHTRIQAEMAGGAETAAILDALNSQRADARERQAAMERQIREEARRLRGGIADGTGEAAGGGAVAGRKAVDFENLAFAQGNHLMTNKKCDLPQKSYRAAHKGYEEVHVPALKPKEFAAGEKLMPVSDLPSWAQPAFKGMQTLNRIQSRVADMALFGVDNMLLCAPTGAGKTNVAMLAILHELGQHMNEDGTIKLNDFKVVYVAPMKALVAEMVGNFGSRLSDAYGINVRELTGDMNLTKSEIEETQIIVTTPEKWDIITRKSGDRTYTQKVRLLIIDEIHLLHDDRGPVLESIVARTVRQIEATQEMIRLVGLSATLPNYEDVAAFLRVKPDKGLFYFDNSFRPCPLAQQYIGVSVKKPLQRFQLMNEICYKKCLEEAGTNQVLIFVHSRKETYKTAKFLQEEAMRNDDLAKFVPGSSASREVLQEEAEQCTDPNLKTILPHGFAIHHAGMSRANRTLVEDLFAGGHVQVLVSTATLAWGVNLPAHTVIIKGTQVYNPAKGNWQELSPLDVMQMFGRAGRPQYDTQGMGIIITSHQELQFYLSLFNMQLPIESQFVQTIPDNLNAEIVLGTVQNIRDAATWLGYGYLYVRMMRNPQLYGVPLDALDTDRNLFERRMDLAHSAANILDKNNLIKYDRRTGNFQVTDLGRIASHYYVTHHTIATYNEHLKPTMGDIELLRLFALSDEFKYIIVREEEKLELAKLIDRVPIPVKEALDEPTAKINVLLQAYVSQLKLEGLALSSDMVYVTQSAGRLMRCLFEICLKRGWAGLTDKSLALCKMVSQRMWGSQTPLRQVALKLNKGPKTQLPKEVLSKMEKKDLAWERYYDLSAQELGALINMAKMGKQLHKFIHEFPRLELAAHVQPITRSVLKIDLVITPDFKWNDGLHGFVEPFWIVVEDSDSEYVLHHEFFLLKKQFMDDDHTVAFTVPISEPLPPQYFIKVVSDKWLQCETVLPVSFRHLILPEKYPPPTELLDLQALPISALRNAEFEGLYQRFRSFNPIQTQTFNVLYNLDDSVLVAAPTGSGKTVCAEFALLRMIKEASAGKGGSRAVYIAPKEELAKERFADWNQKFGSAGLGLNVCMLTGDPLADYAMLREANIVISTPEYWDMLSRRWRQPSRKEVQKVALFIVDELHLIGGANGPVLEVIVSRMRYISSQLSEGPTIRFVGLCTSLANAKDLGEWIGASSHGLYNFPPGVRPVPLEIHIQGFDITNLDSRMQAMARPCYSALTNHAGDKPTIVFVPSKRHARQTAVDLWAYASADGKGDKFLQAQLSDIEALVERVKEVRLRDLLKQGIGYLHEAMHPADQDILHTLFQSGAIQVIVATAGMCWGMSLAAHLVVIMGTQYYDGAHSQGANDYPVTDLLQMMGRASRPDIDDSGKCVLMCHTPRKEYYKKFLFEPFPVESHLDHFLHDHMVAEIVNSSITSKQDAVDYLTWTFFYRRLAQNPNYYNLQGVSHRHLSDHLSDLIETTLSELETAKIIAIDEDTDELEALNSAMISSYYYLSYNTVDLLQSSLTAKTKLKGLLEIISAASEFDDLPVRPGEEESVERLLRHAKLAITSPVYTDPHTKANALIQAHFQRTNLSGDLATDQAKVLTLATRLLQACVDVVSTNSWLNPAIAAMEMSQMVIQAMWQTDPVLLQLPHFTRDLAKKCAQANISTIIASQEEGSSLADMEENERRELLQMSDPQLADVARVCNRYPDIEVEFDVVGGETVTAGEPVQLIVRMERSLPEGQELAPVHAPRYPGRKEENWWLLVGRPADNSCLVVKRVPLKQKGTSKLQFNAPEQTGKQELSLYFMCDSWNGCDQEYPVELDVQPGKDGADEMDED
ncbi:TPA: DExH-box ATP-dependent RNA helicase DExH12 [Trebouxia sp. C0005]